MTKCHYAGVYRTGYWILLGVSCALGCEGNEDLVVPSGPPPLSEAGVPADAAPPLPYIDASVAVPTDAQASTGGVPGTSDAQAPTVDGGPDAVDGPPLLFQILTEPPGAHCSAGGVAFLGGADTNNNGVLDVVREVTQTTYVCSGEPCATVEGSLELRHIEEWESFVAAGCSAVSGELTVGVYGVDSLSPPATALVSVGALTVPTFATLTSLTLPALTTINGDVTVSAVDTLTSISLPALTTIKGNLTLLGNAALASVSLPELATIDGELAISSGLLTELDLSVLTTAKSVAFSSSSLVNLELPALATVSSFVYIIGNEGLVHLGLPVLTTLNGSLQIVTNVALTEIDLSSLSNALGGGLYISNNDALSDITLPQLESATALRFESSTELVSIQLPLLTTITDLSLWNCPALTTLSAPQLATVVGTLGVTRNAALTTLGLPALETVHQRLEISDHEALATLELPALERVDGNLWINDNLSLKQCLVDALHDQLTTEPGSYFADGNATGSCP